MYRIEAEVLVPGRGEPLRNGCVVIDGASLTYAGPAAGAPDTSGAEVHRVPAVMPGMWDCHGHFMGALVPDLATLATTPPALAALRVSRDARVALDAGFTSVREVGGLGVWLAAAVAEGSVPGPTVYGAGAVLSPTGGHADLHMYPWSWVCELSDRVGTLRQCDGVAECLRAVRLQLRAGARLIKICASGGVMSQIDDPVHQQFSDEEMRAIVEEAGRAERVVAAHCHGKPGIMAALRAGVRTIEHGTYLDEEAADAMRECGAILVPTRLIVEEFLAHGAIRGMPDYALRKLRDIADRHAASIALAHDRGVRIALGTDVAGSSPATPAHWGQNAAELVHLVKAGLSPLEAIEAATATAPDTLGPQAPRSGVLAAGSDADVIAVSADPSVEVSVLTEPANVTHVWKGGALVKSPATVPAERG
ncbi:MAG TPA: amidohydrolase family protein [Acidimicrobiales bacterium]|nr:amidohydrolase family protein [Acidimicrobiales bacterium]